jgi:hypothetical protein
MNVLNYIPRLPIELKNCIYEYIDIDTRIELLTHVCNIRKFTEYFRAISSEKNVKLFETFIRNQILTVKCVLPHSSHKSWHMKRSLSNMFPVVKYKIYNRQQIVRNEIYHVIVRHANIEYIPRRFNNYEPRGLEWKRQQFILEHATSIYSIFSTFECGKNHRDFKYHIKKILLYYIISIIMNGKERALQKMITRKHAEIKIWMKRNLPKPLKQAARLYQRRAKQREKEQIKFAKQKAKEDAKRLKQKAKELSKENTKKNKPKIIIIKRKRILNS